MWRNLAILSVLLLLVSLAGGSSARAQAGGTADSLEKQIVYLEGALAEGLRTKDWQMADMALQGFKAAGVTGAALESSMLRAERQAALESVPQDLRAQIEVWGLASRAKLGDQNALTVLRALGNDDIPPVKAPDAAMYKEKPAEAQAQQKAYQAYLGLLSKQDCALLCLAMLKEPKVLDRVMTTMRSRATATFYNFNPLILAALAADPQTGWKNLVDLCANVDEKMPVETQTLLLQGLANLASPPKFAMPDAPFKVDADVTTSVPKDAAAALWTVVATVAKRWKPNATQTNPPYQIVQIANSLPTGPENAEALAALTEMKGRITGQMAQYINKQIDALLAKNGKVIEQKPASPPRPPGDF